MKQQISVQYDNSEDAMYGSGEAGDIDFAASEARFERKLEKELKKHFPGAEITIETGFGRYRVDGETDTDAAETVGIIVNRVWEKFDWMVQK